MKIAILTQPLKNNYGGILQAYALQQFLKSQGHSSVTIDRQINYRSKTHYILKNLENILISIIFKLNLRNFIKYKNDEESINTINFIKENIITSRPIQSNREMVNYFSKNHYDAIIVGSDQTWRPPYSPNIFNFFLDFVEDKKPIKLAYASSFGVDDWEYTETETLRCRELAKKFDAISVRELSGTKLCIDKLDVEAELVLDPTLLLTAEDYLIKLNICTKEKKGNILLTYILDKTIEKQRIIDIVAKKLSLSIFNSKPDSHSTDTKKSKKNKLIKVNEWVKSFNDAEFIVTDSFHGCVFSILFNKPFIAIGNDNRGIARFTSLLEIFNIKKRLITTNKEDVDDVLSDNINWTEVNSILKEKRVYSCEFLTKNLNKM